MGALCCCNSNGLIKSPRAKSDQKQSLLSDADKTRDEYESDEDQNPTTNPQSSYIENKDNDGDNSSDASGQEEDDEEKAEPDKTFRQWIELAFYSFAGSSAHSKKKLYMNMSELNTFLKIVNLDNNDEDDEDLKITKEKVLTAIDKIDNQTPLISCNEFREYFCDKMVNPKCEHIQVFIEKQSNWLLLQNALRIFDVVDVDKSGSIEYGEFETFCGLIGETEKQNIELLWHLIDKDNNGEIVIHELFEWYQKRLIGQQQQILDNPQAETPR